MNSSKDLWNLLSKIFKLNEWIQRLQAWTNYAPDADRARLGMGPQNLWDAPNFSGVHILSSQKQKQFIRSTSFQSNRENNEKVTVNSKYYHEHQPICNILIKVTYLMAAKLLYLLMDLEIFN